MEVQEVNDHRQSRWLSIWRLGRRQFRGRFTGGPSPERPGGVERNETLTMQLKGRSSTVIDGDVRAWEIR